MKKKLIIIVFLLSLILLTTKVEARNIKAIEPKITLESCPIFGDPDADGTRPSWSGRQPAPDASWRNPDMQPRGC